MTNSCLKLQEQPLSRGNLTIFYKEMLTARQIRHLWVASDNVYFYQNHATRIHSTMGKSPLWQSGTNTPNHLQVGEEVWRTFTAPFPFPSSLSTWRASGWQESFSSMKADRNPSSLYSTMAKWSLTGSVHLTKTNKGVLVSVALNSCRAAEAAIAKEAQRINKLVFILQTVGSLLTELLKNPIAYKQPQSCLSFEF